MYKQYVRSVFLSSRVFPSSLRKGLDENNFKLSGDRLHQMRYFKIVFFKLNFKALKFTCCYSKNCSIVSIHGQVDLTEVAMRLQSTSIHSPFTYWSRFDCNLITYGYGQKNLEKEEWQITCHWRYVIWLKSDQAVGDIGDHTRSRPVHRRPMAVQFTV